MRSLFKFYFCIALLCLPGCTRNPGQTTTQANGQGFGGIAGLDNSRPRCTFVEKESLRYIVHCQVVVIDDDGNEIPAKQIADGITLRWLPPYRTEGGEVAIEKCEVDSSFLSQECFVRLNSNVPAKVQFDLEITEPATQKKEVESDALLFPFTAESFGNSPALLNYRIDGTSLGFQNDSLVAIKAAVGPTLATCVQEKTGRVFFATDGHVYSVKDGNLKLYLGSPNPANLNENSHRLRQSLGVTPERGVYREYLKLACGKDRVFVLDAQNERVLIAKDSGPVESIKIPAPTVLGYSDIELDENEVPYIVTGGAKIIKLSGGGNQVIETHDPTRYVSSFALGKDGVIYYAYSNRGVPPIYRRDKNGSVTLINGSEPTVPPIGSIIWAIVRNDAGELFVAGSSSIQKLDGEGILHPVAGSGVSGFEGDGGLAVAARLSDVMDFSIDKEGNIYIADSANHRIRKVNKAGRIETLAGTEAAIMDNKVEYEALTATFGEVSGIALGSDDSIYVSDRNHQIQKIDPTGKVTVLVGSGLAGLSPDGPINDQTQINSPSDIVMTPDGRLYFSDRGNERIRLISPSGEMTTVAMGAADRLAWQNGKLYFSDTSNVYEADAPTNPSLLFSLANPPLGFIPLSDGTIVYADLGSTIMHASASGQSGNIAGIPNTPGFSGDNGIANQALLDHPSDVLLDEDGSTIYVSDTNNGRIRRLFLREDRAYQIDTFLGGPSQKKDCGGPTSIKLPPQDLQDAIKAGLLVVCNSKPISFDIKKHCEPSELNKRLVAAFAQSYGKATVITRTRSNCPLLQ